MQHDAVFMLITNVSLILLKHADIYNFSNIRRINIDRMILNDGSSNSNFLLISNSINSKKKQGEQFETFSDHVFCLF